MNNKAAKIQTCLWFDGKAEEAVKFYTSIFKNSSIGRTTYSANSVMTVEFFIEGRSYVQIF